MATTYENDEGAFTRIIEDVDGACPGDDCEYNDPEMPHRHEPRHLFNAEVRIGPGERHGTLKVLVNGQDLASNIMAEGFKVTYDADSAETRVTMTIATNDCEIDLPDAVVEVQ